MGRTGCAFEKNLRDIKISNLARRLDRRTSGEESTDHRKRKGYGKNQTADGRMLCLIQRRMSV
jgi:hypothetical protein